MGSLRPRSLLLFLLMGYGCLALPLGLGLHTASGFVRTLGSDAERLLDRGMETARRVRFVVSLSSDMERNAHQFAVLRDPALLQIYEQRHQQILEELAALDAGTADVQIRAAVDALRGLAVSGHAALKGGRADETATMEMLDRFDEMSLLAREVEALGTRQFDSDLADLGASATQARAELLARTVLLVPVSVVLAGVFSALVVRPVRELGRAIRLLGEGRLKGRVEISGPTEIASLAHELEWLRERLASSEQEKHGFLRRMSHELKTPLASVREGVALLADGSVGVLGERQREVVDIMRESAGRLEVQIHNLLAFSALSVSRTSSTIERVRVDTAVTEVLRAHRLEIERKRIQVDACLDEVAVMFDPEQLLMVLDNVIGNASKFTPDGGDLRIALRRKRDRAIVDVIDSGPGIPVEERELVFKPFYQGSASREAPVRGTGVGLAVVRECVEAHGATVQVVDGDRHGAHLRLTFRGARRAR